MSKLYFGDRIAVESDLITSTEGVYTCTGVKKAAPVRIHELRMQYKRPQALITSNIFFKKNHFYIIGVSILR
jgi:hypothetical protein